MAGCSHSGSALSRQGLDDRSRVKRRCWYGDAFARAKARGRFEPGSPDQGRVRPVRARRAPSGDLIGANATVSRRARLFFLRIQASDIARAVELVDEGRVRQILYLKRRGCRVLLLDEAFEPGYLVKKGRIRRRAEQRHVV